MTVLIMTHSQENESFDMVRSALESLGHSVARYDTDLFPTTATVAAYHDSDGESFSLCSEEGAETINSADVTAVWNRRYYTGSHIPRDLEPQLRAPSLEESRRTLWGTTSSLDVFCLDPRRDSFFAQQKAVQLRVARELGLKIPKTLITNDPDQVRAFASKVGGGIVCKMMSSFAVLDTQGNDSVVFTNPVSEQDLADMSGLDLCPMTFQEKIDKELELRVTVVGHQIFAASIDSQISKRATTDWRRDGDGLAESWRPYELPKALERTLLNLCSRLNLNYGAIDLILTPDGHFVFLEVNPAGEFFWLELGCELQVSQAIAEVLVDPTARRVPGRNTLLGHSVATPSELALSA